MKNFIELNLLSNETEMVILVNLDHVEIIFPQEKNTVLVMMYTHPKLKSQDRIRYLVKEKYEDVKSLMAKELSYG